MLSINLSQRFLYVLIEEKESLSCVEAEQEYDDEGDITDIIDGDNEDI